MRTLTTKANAGLLSLLERLKSWNQMDFKVQASLFDSMSSYNFTSPQDVSDAAFAKTVRALIAHVDKPILVPSLVSQLYSRLLMQVQSHPQTGDGLNRLKPYEIDNMIRLLDPPSRHHERQTSSGDNREQLVPSAREELMGALTVSIGDVNRDALNALSALNKQWSSIDATLQYKILDHIKTLITQYYYYDKDIYPKFPAHIECDAIQFIRQLAHVKCNYHIDLVIGQNNIGAELTRLLYKILTKKSRTPRLLDHSTPQNDFSSEALEVLTSLRAMNCTWGKLDPDNQFHVLELAMLEISKYRERDSFDGIQQSMHQDFIAALDSIASIGVQLPAEHLSALLEKALEMTFGEDSVDLGVLKQVIINSAADEQTACTLKLQTLPQFASKFSSLQTTNKAK